MMKSTWKRVFYPVALGVGITLIACPYAARAKDIQFNTDFLDVKNRDNINLDQFSRQGFILPGIYTLQVKVNGRALPQEFVLAWVTPPDDPKGSELCAEPDLIAQLGIKPELAEKFSWIKHQERQCLAPQALEGMEMKADLGQSALLVSLPQAYLEYNDDTWDPPARWDNGIPGIIADYSINSQFQRDEDAGGNRQNISGNGTLGANMGPWRLRADWQANYNHDDSDDHTATAHDQGWSRFYAYRALPALGAKLTLGENYLTSDIFDSFNFAGASMMSDDQMLPPKLRGYAPEIVGVAHTNAKIEVSWQGRVLYETQVPAGPFRIQDLNQSVSGTLHVRVIEQNGQVQEFDVSTASVPFLTRPGMLRYKLALGRPEDWDHHLTASPFASAEMSWGVANGWSLYGGAIGEKDYQALAIGTGKDLGVIGALAIDVTHSHATLPQDAGYSDKALNGNSYRVSYSRDFDAIDGHLTFAGYRFSEKNFMSMSDYLDARKYYRPRNGRDKEMYTVTWNQNFREQGISTYLSYSRRTYWDSPEQTNYNLMISWYVDFWSLKNVGMSVNAYRNQYDDAKDDGIYFSISLPWGNNGTVSYNGTYNDTEHSNKVGYSTTRDNGDSWQINAGESDNGAKMDGYYSHKGTLADADYSASYEEGSYSSVGLSLRGGMTLTAQGGALHRGSTMGGTRLLLDTDGIADVPVGSYSTPVYSNMFGKAVLPDISSYYRSQAQIDLNHLPEKATATQSVVQATLTEGAIGYRRFDVVSGEKVMAILRLVDGTFPPFGAEIRNERQKALGLVSDDGNAWIAGVNPGEKLQVVWDGAAQCVAELPDALTEAILATPLLLPCRLLNEQSPATPTTSPKSKKPLIQENVLTPGESALPGLAADGGRRPVPLAASN
ncbi:TPA: fimbrial biogenesis outer membrane usher protein [Salmonella enterica]|nr:fimbrial biogenesis outer membrane usher protein [Salmonella enterica subsp. indica serovar 11:b:e,n,x]HBC0165809.1 fimbrial biogenesis outer membrane usher protein [Salmonella enterica subsp. indica]HCL5298396.1 fimbrial biogenesis outer membrane usher protein [Salmonella enterica]